MVLGATRVACSELDFSTGDSVCRAEHHGCGLSAVHFHHCTDFSGDALSFQGRHFLLLWRVGGGDDFVCVFASTRDQKCAD